jgi:DNA-binding PadR family transcriptional regulator
MTKHNTDSDLSLAILGLLAGRPMSGYDLRKVFRVTAMTAFSASPGAIYPALRRLEHDGLIEGAVERKNTLRPRQLFSLSRRGKAALVGSLIRPVTRDDVVHRMDGLLLRFSFMSGLVGAGEIAAFLRRLAEETEGYLGVLEEELREDGPGLPFTGRAALTQGVESYRTTARWARRTLAELKKHRPAKGA